MICHAFKKLINMKHNKNKNTWRVILTLSLAAIILFAGLHILLNTTEDVVFFADPQLALAIRNNLEIWDGPLYLEDVQQITELDAYGMGIRRLEGIENLRQLESLNLHDNFVEDVSPLAQLEHLAKLNLRNNEIYNLEQIKFDEIVHLPLVELSLRHNVFDLDDGSRIRLVDISLLGELTSLEVLELRDNHIADISPLASLDQLTYLDIRENRFENIEALRDLRLLESLNLRENQIRDLSPLKGLSALVYLNIHSTQIETGWEVMSQFRDLETLIMRDVPIADQAEALGGLTNLARLNMRNTDINDISFLQNMVHMEIMDLRGNNIADLAPLERMSILEEADLRGNQIEDISPLSHLTQLRSLNLRENSITDLGPLARLSNLRYLNIHSNPVEVGLEAIGDLHHLETLIMRNVFIGDAHQFLLNLTNLQGLNIRNTGITSYEPLGMLMTAGALQDHVEDAITASVNILDNPITDDGTDPYEPIRAYWENISYRDPLELP